MICVDCREGGNLAVDVRRTEDLATERACFDAHERCKGCDCSHHVDLGDSVWVLRDGEWHCQDDRMQAGTVAQ